VQRAPSELSAYQKKTFQIDGHVGITIAGLTADARTLSRFMQVRARTRVCVCVCGGVCGGVWCVWGHESVGKGSLFSHSARFRHPSKMHTHVPVKRAGIDRLACPHVASLTQRPLFFNVQTECMNHKYVYDVELPVSRLVTMVGNRLQRSTIGYGRRPFGVGILVAGYDERGAHIFEIEPSSNFFNSKAQAIGARSQSARTYLERNLDKVRCSCATSSERVLVLTCEQLRVCARAHV
jgi:20S proteasome alpha/beta subunit